MAMCITHGAKGPQVRIDAVGIGPPESQWMEAPTVSAPARQGAANNADPECGVYLDIVDGDVQWDPIKSLWFSVMAILGLAGGAYWFSWSAFGLFVISAAALELLGNTIGLHRLAIHRSFKCSVRLEYFLVYCGVLLGAAGPFGVARAHDARDYAQRQPRAHSYFTHETPFWHDLFWQMHCRVRLRTPVPVFASEERLSLDQFYRTLESTWMIHQLPLAVLFFAFAGWGGVFLGVCARIAACILGHWVVAHLVHRTGSVHYEVVGTCVQGHNTRLCALITMGESLHNNHHAFPGSANYSLGRWELDPGWWALKGLAWVGAVWDLKTPSDLPDRSDLRLVHKPQRAPPSPSSVTRTRLSQGIFSGFLRHSRPDLLAIRAVSLVPLCLTLPRLPRVGQPALKID